MKRKGLICAGVLLCLCLICTAASFAHYAEELNRVTVTSTVPGSLRISENAVGTLEFAHKQAVSLPENCRVKALLTEEGAAVQEGDGLLQLYPEDLTLELYGALIRLEQLEQTCPAGEAEEQLLSMQKEQLRQQAAALQLLLKQGSVVTAPRMGIVTALPDCGQKGQTIQLGIPEDGCRCSWQMDGDAWRSFTTVTVHSGGISGSIEIDRAFFDPDRDRMCCQSAVFWPEESFIEGQRAELSLLYVSGEYENLLPLRCIRQGTDGGSYAYLVKARTMPYGTECYLVQTGVTILEQDDRWAAVLAPLQDAVEHCSRTPSDLESVRIVR